MKNESGEILARYLSPYTGEWRVGKVIRSYWCPRTNRVMVRILPRGERRYVVVDDRDVE